MRTQELWRQRLQERVPLQYLTASAHWRDMVLAVGPGALIPRPETEQLVDLASAAVRESPDLSMGHWLDLGTGSGALALGLVSVLSPSAQVWPHHSCCSQADTQLLHSRWCHSCTMVAEHTLLQHATLLMLGADGGALDELAPAEVSTASETASYISIFGRNEGHRSSTPLECLQVTAVDASEDAAAWAMYNVARTGMGNKVRVAVGSWYDPVGALTGSVAGIVSNPPYIRRSDLRGLQPEVLPRLLRSPCGFFRKTGAPCLQCCTP